MPILLDRGPGGCTIVAGKDTACERLQARRHPAGSEWIEIGLLNNMPEAALEATEQQFLDLLGAAAGRVATWSRSITEAAFTPPTAT